jgi:hypothetical protein
MLVPLVISISASVARSVGPCGTSKAVFTPGIITIQMRWQRARGGLELVDYSLFYGQKYLE